MRDIRKRRQQEIERCQSGRWLHTMIIGIGLATGSAAVEPIAAGPVNTRPLIVAGDGSALLFHLTEPAGLQPGQRLASARDDDCQSTTREANALRGELYLQFLDDPGSVVSMSGMAADVRWCAGGLRMEGTAIGDDAQAGTSSWSLRYDADTTELTVQIDQDGASLLVSDSAGGILVTYRHADRFFMLQIIRQLSLGSRSLMPGTVIRLRGT